MQQAIKITGMTCEGCRKGVTEKLMTLPGIEQVEVNLQKGEAQFDGCAAVVGRDDSTTTGHKIPSR